MGGTQRIDQGLTRRRPGSQSVRSWLILLTWFSGLALLVVGHIGRRPLFGSITLVGIAANCRAEGVLFVLASLCANGVGCSRVSIRSAHASKALCGWSSSSRAPSTCIASGTTKTTNRVHRTID